MNAIFYFLPNLVKEKVGQCLTTKVLWERLNNIYLKKHSSQDVYVYNLIDPDIKESNNDDPKEEVEEMSEIEFQNEVVRVIKELKSKRERAKLLEEELKIVKAHVRSLNKKN